MQQPANTFPKSRGVFCNRTLNLRAIRAIGYDMDYTLIHYRVEEWERRAYEHLRAVSCRRRLAGRSTSSSIPRMVCRGLIIDIEQGNLLKANRFGFVKRAAHGTRFWSSTSSARAYARTIVDLSEPRWVFLNTLFSLSEGCMYAQLVDLLDQRKLPGALGYADLYVRVKHVLDAAHMEGRAQGRDRRRAGALRAARSRDRPRAAGPEASPARSCCSSPTPSGTYTAADDDLRLRPLPAAGMTWRELFDVIIVGARKPEFFTTSSPLFEVVTEDGLLRPVTGPLQARKVYLGGSAVQVERHLGLSGDEILYVGDHMFGDVHVTKSVLRWRTALILRELEDGDRLRRGVPGRRRGELVDLMEQKEQLEARVVQVRLELQRLRHWLRPPRPPAGRGALAGAGRRVCAASWSSRCADRPAREGLEQARPPRLGAAHARGQRQEPPRAPDRALRGHLHLARLELPSRDAVRLPRDRPEAACPHDAPTW